MLRTVLFAGSLFGLVLAAGPVVAARNVESAPAPASRATPDDATLADCVAGMEAYQADEFAAAIGPLTRCLDLDLRDDVRALVLRARARGHFETGIAARALTDQQAALALAEPHDVWPLVMLAVYHRALKQYEAALAVLAQALTFDEDGPGSGPGIAVHYHTGLTLYETGRLNEAVAAFTRAIPLEKNYGFALYRRALAYEALGDRDRARADLLRAAALAPRGGYDDEIRAKLAAYGVAEGPREPKAGAP